MAVGARPVVAAINCELTAGPQSLEADLAVARAIAREVRERDGGLPGVRALGLALETKGRAQVSMNLIDLAATGVETALESVRRAAIEAGKRREGGGAGLAPPRCRTRAVQRGVPRLERAVSGIGRSKPGSGPPNRPNRLNKPDGQPEGAASGRQSQLRPRC